MNIRTTTGAGFYSDDGLSSLRAASLEHRSCLLIVGIGLGPMRKRFPVRKVFQRGDCACSCWISFSLTDHCRQHKQHIFEHLGNSDIIRLEALTSDVGRYFRQTSSCKQDRRSPCCPSTGIRKLQGEIQILNTRLRSPLACFRLKPAPQEEGIWLLRFDLMLVAPAATVLTRSDYTEMVGFPSTSLCPESESQKRNLVS